MLKVAERLQKLIKDAEEWNLHHNWKVFASNEIPFWIIDYDPIYEHEVRTAIPEIISASEKWWYSPFHCDLYESVLDIISRWWRYPPERYIEIEEEHWFDYLSEHVIKPKIEWEQIATYIKEKSVWSDLIFVSRIWTARPFIRAHNLLNNVLSKFTSTSVVFFYPWTYEKRKGTMTLNLFNKFDDAHYYRAFRLYTS